LRLRGGLAYEINARKKEAIRCSTPLEAKGKGKEARIRRCFPLRGCSRRRRKMAAVLPGRRASIALTRKGKKKKHKNTRTRGGGDNQKRSQITPTVEKTILNAFRIPKGGGGGGGT